MRAIIQSIPPVFRNFYFLSATSFLVWMLFFDSNDLITQSKLGSKQSELESAKSFYEQKIVEVKNDREALSSDPALLEKMAREKYLMKKKNEDVFVVVAE